MNDQPRMQTANRSVGNKAYGGQRTSAYGGQRTNTYGGQRTPTAQAQGYDFVGAMVRRKWVMLPFILAGLVIGYFLFTKQPAKFASTLKLMIWTQSPPTIVNGEALVQPVPLGKHQSLLTSQVVLGNAIKEGNFGELKTFKDVANPMGQLKANLTAVPVEGAADTLLLTAKGPDPKELPEILTSVIAAYQVIIGEDTAQVGKESVDLIGKLQERLIAEKAAAEKRHSELIQKLVISSDPRTGQFMNPNLLKVDALKTQIATVERSYREVADRLDSITDIQKIPQDKRGDMLKVVAIEASKYLSLRAEEDVVTSELKLEQDDRQKLFDQLGTRIAVLQNNISELNLRKTQLKLKDMGDQHPEVLRVRTDIDFYGTQLTTLMEQQQQLRATMQSESITAKEKEKENTPKPTSPLALNKYDNELIKIYYSSLKREAERLKKSIEGLEEDVVQEDKKASEIGVEIGELNMLTSEIKEKDVALRGIVDRLSEIALVASNYTSTKIRVIDTPGPGYQVEPKMPMFLSVAGFVGALVGFGVILLMDWADMSFRSPTEIQEKLGVPVIGRIPFIPKNKIGAGNPHLLVLNKDTSSANEAYRSCRTAMLFLAKENNGKIMLFTSPSAGDGKSTTAANTAICFAQAGFKTVLIDADLRRPRAHVYLGEDKAPGLKDLVAAEVDFHTLIKSCHVQENLSLIASGGHPSNPTEFFESNRFRKLLEDLKAEFDYIIIDSPPVLPVADATALSTMCDMVFLVLRIRKGVELAAEKAVETLRMVNGNVQGIIVNGVDKKSYYSDYGKYGYNGYGGYHYYATRYYEKDNEKYYKAEKEKVFSEEA